MLLELGIDATRHVSERVDLREPACERIGIACQRDCPQIALGLVLLPVANAPGHRGDDH